jgi:hypothetical protein
MPTSVYSNEAVYPETTAPPASIDGFAFYRGHPQIVLENGYLYVTFGAASTSGQSRAGDVLIIERRLNAGAYQVLAQINLDGSNADGAAVKQILTMPGSPLPAGDTIRARGQIQRT